MKTKKLKNKLDISHKSIKKLTPSKNAFASLARAIIYQQISGRAASSIERKFLELFSKTKKLKSVPQTVAGAWAAPGEYPKPAKVLKLSDEEFRSAGLSGQKREYLRDLARKFIDGTIDPEKFPKMTDEEIREHLIQVKGIGGWTADMFLMFALNRPNVLPYGDLAIRKGFMRAFNLRSIPDEKKMRKLAREYESDHSQLSLYLWHIMDNK